VIAGEFPYLMKFPGLVIKAGDTAEKEWRTVAVDFIVHLGVLKL
jgi:hypothetical protein